MKENLISINMDTFFIYIFFCLLFVLFCSVWIFSFAHSLGEKQVATYGASDKQH